IDIYRKQCSAFRNGEVVPLSDKWRKRRTNQIEIGRRGCRVINGEMEETATESKEPLVDASWTLVVADEDVTGVYNVSAARSVEVGPKLDRKIAGAKRKLIAVLRGDIVTAIEAESTTNFPRYR